MDRKAFCFDALSYKKYLWTKALFSAVLILIYQWILEGAQPQAEGCSDPEAYSCTDNDNYIIEVGGTTYDNSCDSCENGIPCEGYYGSNTDCYYPKAPSAEEIEISYIHILIRYVSPINIAFIRKRICA